MFDAVNGIALALSDLVSRKLISHKSDALTVRKVLSEKLRSYNSAENGYLSATGTTTKVYFDAKQDGPLSLDVVNLLVSGNILHTVGESGKENICFTTKKQQLL